MPSLSKFPVVALVLGILIVPAQAADRPVQVGDPVAKLSFKDIRYLPRSLEDFKDKKAFVLVFTNTTCPLVQRYWPTLNALEREFRGQGAQFLAVNVGPDDSIVAMASQAVRHDVEFPFVKDFDHGCVKALGVQRTPEVAVVDAQGRLRYRGRIDDQYRLGGTRTEPSRHDLKEALAAVLAGREVAVKETPVDGCPITKPEARKPSGALTFADHVAPILRKHCIECHRPGTAAPFSLLTYKQTTAKADALAEVVAEQRMPPWYGSPDHGKFTNRRGLTPEERETLVEWVHSGMAAGDLDKLPKITVEDTGGWLIGKPDLILQAPEHELPAGGDIPYKYIVLPHVFQEDTWMQGIQILPDNPRTVHHCNMAYFKFPDGVKQANFITGTVPGGEPMTLENGVAFRIPKGSALVLQIHYVSTGKPEKCRIRTARRNRCSWCPTTASTGRCPTAGSRPRSALLRGPGWRRSPITTTPNSTRTTPTPRPQCATASKPIRK
jgi:peroxiredoxin